MLLEERKPRSIKTGFLSQTLEVARTSSRIESHSITIQTLHDGSLVAPACILTCISLLNGEFWLTVTLQEEQNEITVKKKLKHSGKIVRKVSNKKMDK